METLEMTSLWDQYRAYIAWLNGRSWNELGAYAASDVQHNGRNLGLTDCRDMLINDFDQIPDLFFKIGLLTCEPPFFAARPEFDCPPKGPSSAFPSMDVGSRLRRMSSTSFVTDGLLRSGPV